MSDLLPLPELAARERLSARTVRHWVVVGVRLPDGSRVRLRGVRQGGRWFVSGAELETFRARCTAAALPPDGDEDALPVPCPSKGYQRELERDLADLRAMGLLD